MNTIDILGDEETFRQIVERSITSFTDDELTAVVSFSFNGCKELQEVSLPLITKLPDYAFSGCSSLSNGKFPKVTSIQNQVFYDCFSLSSIIVGTELDDETAICTLSATDDIPSSIGAIYVPYNLQDKYKTATNWSKFASKIQAYDTPVSCQSLTITAEDVPGYKTSTKVHYEAVCTYSIEGMMQTGTKVFKGDAVSNIISANPSEESSRQVEVSYTFLGQTATTTITQDKYIGDPLGGTIFYIDDAADGEYKFYDAEGNVISSVAVGDAPAMYKVLTPGTKDKYYVCSTEIFKPVSWTYFKNGNSVYTSLGTGLAIGTGKSNTATVMAADDGAYITVNSNGYPTIWYQLQQERNAYRSGCNDWFVPSKEELDALRTSRIIDFSDRSLWSSSERSSSNAWNWAYRQWDYYSGKDNFFSVLFIRAF